MVRQRHSRAFRRKTERIRRKASYNVSSTGLGLKQTLRCASDSYKFDLSTDVTSQGLEGCGFAYLCTDSVDQAIGWLQARGILGGGIVMIG